QASARGGAVTGASGRPRHDAPMVVRAVGLISGTSMDGIDAAAVEIAAGVPLRAALRAYLTLPYPAEMRAALREVCRAGSTPRGDARGVWSRSARVRPLSASNR